MIPPFPNHRFQQPRLRKKIQRLPRWEMSPLLLWAKCQPPHNPVGEAVAGAADADAVKTRSRLNIPNLPINQPPLRRRPNLQHPKLKNPC